jgi:hypothetical protein
MTRTLRIEKVPATTLYCIRWNGGGEVPAMLAGSYTNQAAAKQAIEVWKSQSGRVEVEEDSPPADEAVKRIGRPKKEIQPL